MSLADGVFVVVVDVRMLLIVNDKIDEW